MRVQDSNLYFYYLLLVVSFFVVYVMMYLLQVGSCSTMRYAFYVHFSIISGSILYDCYIFVSLFVVYAMYLLQVVEAQ